MSVGWKNYFSDAKLRDKNALWQILFISTHLMPDFKTGHGDESSQLPQGFTHEFWSNVLVVQLVNYLNEQYCFSRWNTLCKIFAVGLSLKPVFILSGMKLAGCVFWKCAATCACRKNAVWIIIIDAVLLWCTTQWMGFLNMTAETRAISGW